MKNKKESRFSDIYPDYEVSDGGGESSTANRALRNPPFMEDEIEEGSYEGINPHKEGGDGYEPDDRNDGIALGDFGSTNFRGNMFEEDWYDFSFSEEDSEILERFSFLSEEELNPEKVKDVNLKGADSDIEDQIKNALQAAVKEVQEVIAGEKKPEEIVSSAKENLQGTSKELQSEIQKDLKLEEGIRDWFKKAKNSEGGKETIDGAKKAVKGILKGYGEVKDKASEGVEKLLDKFFPDSKKLSPKVKKLLAVAAVGTISAAGIGVLGATIGLPMGVVSSLGGVAALGMASDRARGKLGKFKVPTLNTIISKREGEDDYDENLQKSLSDLNSFFAKKEKDNIISGPGSEGYGKVEESFRKIMRESFGFITEEEKGGTEEVLEIVGNNNPLGDSSIAPSLKRFYKKHSGNLKSNREIKGFVSKIVKAAPKIERKQIKSLISHLISEKGENKWSEEELMKKAKEFEKNGTLQKAQRLMRKAKDKKPGVWNKIKKGVRGVADSLPFIKDVDDEWRKRIMITAAILGGAAGLGSLLSGSEGEISSEIGSSSDSDISDSGSEIPQKSGGNISVGYSEDFNDQLTKTGGGKYIADQLENQGIRIEDLTDSEKNHLIRTSRNTRALPLVKNMIRAIKARQDGVLDGVTLDDY